MGLSLRANRAASPAASFLYGVVALARRRLRFLFFLGGQFIQQLTHGLRYAIAEIPLVGALQNRIDQLTDLGTGGAVQLLQPGQVLGRRGALRTREQPFRRDSQRAGNGHQPGTSHHPVLKPPANGLWGDPNRRGQGCMIHTACLQGVFKTGFESITLVINHKLNIVKRNPAGLQAILG